MKNKSLKQFLLEGSSRQGTLAVLATAAVLAAVIALNLAVSRLPSHYTQIDISDKGIYTVSDQAKEYLKTLNTDVDILILTRGGECDERILKFLDSYAALSDHVTCTTVDVELEPGLVETYQATANQVVVKCDRTGKSTVVPCYGFNTGLIRYDSSYYYFSQELMETAFDADGQITSAVDYVVNQHSAVIYTLAGHGETALSSSVQELMSKSHLDVESLSLLQAGGVPEDCSTLVCNVPVTDLSEDELAMLRSYLGRGGNLVLLLDNAKLERFTQLAGEYGLTLRNGYLADMGSYYQQYYYIFPQINRESSAASTLNGDAAALVAYAGAMTQSAPARESITVTPILSTTDSALLIDKEGNQERGTYLMGASAKEELSDGRTSSVTVFSAVTLISESITTPYPSMANLDLFLNAVMDNVENVSNISIPEKTLLVTYNTFARPAIWAVLFLVVIPGGVLLGGAVLWIRRRRR